MVNQRLGIDWTTLDIIAGPHVDIVHDLRIIPYPFEDNSIDIIFMSHVLEHIPWTMTDKVLLEFYRILKPGGSIEIWVPDLKKLVAGYIDSTEMYKDGWFKFNEEQNQTKWFNGRLFTYGPGEENFHRAAFDYEYLTYCLKKAGFSSTEKMNKPRGIDHHGWINLGVKGIK